MQFAHSGSETEKQPPPHHALPYDAKAGAPHSAALAPFHAIAPVPLHGAVCVSTHGAVPAPHHAAKLHAAHSTALGASPPSALLQSCRKSGNKKVIKIATFLRLTIAADVQITDRAPKMKQNDRSVPHFHFTGDEKEPLIAKMLQKRQDFCFRKANYRNRSGFRNEPIAKRGKSRNELIAATRRTPPMNDAHT